MDIKEAIESLSESMLKPVEELEERRAELRDRWFEVGDDGVLRMRKLRFELNDKIHHVYLLGLERPSGLIVDEVNTELETDLEYDKDDFVVGMFSGKEETALLKVEIKMKESVVSEGLLALHQYAARQFKEIVMTAYPDMAEVLNPDEIETQHKAEGA